MLRYARNTIDPINSFLYRATISKLTGYALILVASRQNERMSKIKKLIKAFIWRSQEFGVFNPKNDNNVAFQK